MQLSIKHLRLNPYTHCDDEVRPGAEFGFWRIVEHTGAGWFPWPSLYSSRERAQSVMDAILAKERSN